MELLRKLYLCKCESSVEQSVSPGAAYFTSLKWLFRTHALSFAFVFYSANSLLYSHFDFTQEYIYTYTFTSAHELPRKKYPSPSHYSVLALRTSSLQCHVFFKQHPVVQVKPQQYHAGQPNIFLLLPRGCDVSATGTIKRRQA